MTHNDAIKFLKNYECVCPYGSSPSDCREHDCEFYIAVNSLEETGKSEVSSVSCDTCKHKETCTNESFCFGNDWEDNDNGKSSN